MNQYVTVVVFDDEPINDTETRIAKKFSRREGFEIPGGCVIKTMVVLVRFLEIGKAARNGGGPNDDELLGGLVIEKFGRPHIHRRRFICHYGNELLVRPMHEVLRACVAEALIGMPTGRPYQM